MTTAVIDLVLAVFKDPGMIAEVRERPLPEDVAQVIRVAASEAAAVQAAQEMTGADAETLVEASVFFLQQILFAPQADSYRVLGASSDAAPERLRENYRWLMKWLHPDRNPDGWEAVYADRVNVAWQDLKTAERRAEYDSRLQAPLQVLHSPGLQRRRPTANNARTPLLSGSTVRRLPAIVLGTVAGLAALLMGAMYWAHRATEQELATRGVAGDQGPQNAGTSDGIDAITGSGMPVASNVSPPAWDEAGNGGAVVVTASDPVSPVSPAAPFGAPQAPADDQAMATLPVGGASVTSSHADTALPADGSLTMTMPVGDAAIAAPGAQAPAEATVRAIGPMLSPSAQLAVSDAAPRVDGVARGSVPTSASAAAPPATVAMADLPMSTDHAPAPAATHLASAGADAAAQPEPAAVADTAVPQASARPQAASPVNAVAEPPAPVVVTPVAPPAASIAKSSSAADPIPIAQAAAATTPGEAGRVAATLAPPPAPSAAIAVPAPTPAAAVEVPKSHADSTLRVAAQDRPNSSSAAPVASTPAKVPQQAPASRPSSESPDESPDTLAATPVAPVNAPAQDASAPVGTPAPASETPPRAPAQAEAEALVREFTIAYNAGDGRGFERLFSLDGGRGATFESMRRRFDSTEMRFLEISQMHWRLSMDRAEATARYRDTFVPRGSRKAITEAGTIQLVLQVDDGSVRISLLDRNAQP